jgi:hypothetical protein
MVCAVVICPWGKDRFARPSQVVAAGTAVPPRKIVTSDAVASTTGSRSALISFLPTFDLIRLRLAVPVETFAQ